MACTLLSNINPNSRQWIICVRVCRGTDTGPIDHTDLVLLDEKGNQMYAEISADNASKFELLLEEGKVYQLRKFLVAPTKSSFKPVRAPFMVWFTKHTVVEEQTGVDVDFPKWTYDLIPFTDIPSPSSSPEYFIDIIGVIVSVSAVEHIQTASRPTPSLKRTVLLCDASDSEIRLHMWGECATRFDGHAVQTIGAKEPVVAFFVGTLPKAFEGQASLSEASACRWYINEDIPAINALRASVQDKFKPLKIIDPSAQDLSLARKQPPIEEKTVKELLSLDLFDCEGLCFSCTVTITRLAPDQRWWFSSCRLCHKTAIPSGAFYRFTDAPIQIALQQMQSPSTASL